MGGWMDREREQLYFGIVYKVLCYVCVYYKVCVSFDKALYRSKHAASPHHHAMPPSNHTDALLDRSYVEI